MSYDPLPQLERLPLELWYYIVSLLPPADLCLVRQVSRKLREVCNDPRVWKHLQLESSTPSTLWRLEQIKPIVAQHSIPHIRSISVHNVRDDVVRYLLNACPHLEELTVSRWTTLSHHALKCNHKSLALKRLHLNGQDTHYTAIDALAIARLIAHCPQLEVLEVLAQAHFHLPTLLHAFARNVPQALRFLTLPTYHTDPTTHGERLLKTCPNLERVLLISNIAHLHATRHLGNLVVCRRVIMDSPSTSAVSL